MRAVVAIVVALALVGEAAHVASHASRMALLIVAAVVLLVGAGELLRGRS